MIVFVGVVYPRFLFSFPRTRLSPIAECAKLASDNRFIQSFQFVLANLEISLSAASCSNSG